MRSPCGPNRLRNSTGPSPVDPNQCGTRVSNSAASPAPRRRRKPSWTAHFQVRLLTAYESGITGEFRYPEPFHAL